MTQCFDRWTIWMHLIRIHKSEITHRRATAAVVVAEKKSSKNSQNDGGINGEYSCEYSARIQNHGRTVSIHPMALGEPLHHINLKPKFSAFGTAKWFRRKILTESTWFHRSKVHSVSTSCPSIWSNCIVLIRFLAVWFGVLFVRDGYFADGVFRFNISLPKEFPNTTEVPVCVLSGILSFHEYKIH